MRFVSYDVCHLIMFVGICCLSYYDVSLIMPFVSLWSLTPIMTFVAHRVCNIWCHMYCASSKSAIHFTNLLTCVHCTVHPPQSWGSLLNGSVLLSSNLFCIHPVIHPSCLTVHPSCLTSILSYIHPVLPLFFPASCPCIKTRYCVNTVRRIYNDLWVKFFSLKIQCYWKIYTMQKLCLLVT